MVSSADFRPAEGHRLDAAFAFAVSLLIIAGGQPLASFTDFGPVTLDAVAKPG